MLPLLLACDNVSCPLNNTVECVYGFYASTRTAGGPFVAGNAVSVADTLTVTALGADSVLINRLYNKSGMKLPVSFYAEMDSIMLTFKDTLGQVARDTIYVSKTNQAHLDDPSCPLHMWHTVTAVSSSHNLIDSILINHPEINYDGLENLQIYFRTAAE